MDLKLQKKLAGSVLGCSSKRVRFLPEALEQVKDAITKLDLKALINDGLVFNIPKRSNSRFNARKRQGQRSKGLQKGFGRRKGKNTARLPSKEDWVKKIRVQREFLKELKDKGMLDVKAYRNLYRKSSGGFFRSRRHIKIYMNEHKLVQENGKQ